MLKIKILIIDDEQDYCLLMKNFFSMKGYEISVAHRLIEGLELLEKIQPSILILDNNLPDGNGWDHYPSIVEKSPSLQVHLVSAYRNKAELSALPPSVTVWEKPVSFSQLENAFHKQT